MATSGTVTFSVTRNEIIQGAARKAGAKKRGSTMGAEDIADFNMQLNAMVKRWNAKGIHIWTIGEATLFPQLGQTRYALALTAADHCADTNLYVTTAITADEASGQTTISVDDTSGITDGDKIGIVLDDGTFHWSTVTSHTSTSVLIALALTDSSAAGNAVYAYTNNIVRPLAITAARRFNVSTTEETPLVMVSHSDYQTLPRKSARGPVNQFYYDRQLSTGYANLWMAPNDPDELVRFTWRRPIEDFNSAGDNPDLPQEWIDTLIWNLGLLMAPEYGVSGQRLSELAQFAAATLDDMVGFDREEGSIYIQPDNDS